MTSKDYDLNLWERNYAEVPAVQGEAQARTVNIHLKEEVSVQDALGNLTIRQKPVDVTGYSAPRLYIEKTDKTKVFFDGTVTDAANGSVAFVLPYQATTAAGDNAGTVYLTKPDGTTLKATGLTLSVQTNDLDGAIESTNDFSALVTALNEVKPAAGTASKAASDAQKAVADANGAISSINAEETKITSAEGTRQTDETARQSAEAARATAEQGRASAEQSRANAESARATAENQRVTESQAAVSSANTATNRANTAAKNAEDAIAGQLDPSIDARIAAKTNVSGGLMGYDDAHAHITDIVAHMTQTQKDTLASAVQNATLGGTAVPKSGTTLVIPMPTAAQVGAVPHTRLPNGVNLNDYRTANILYCTGNADALTIVNRPFDSAFSIIVIPNAFCTQIAVAWTNPGEMLIRQNSWAADGIGTWSAWQKPPASMADTASGSVPLTTPGVRNIDIITKDTAVPTGLADGTVVLRYDP